MKKAVEAQGKQASRRARPVEPRLIAETTTKTTFVHTRAHSEHDANTEAKVCACT